MTNIIQFPGEQEREWLMWEREIRKSCIGTTFDDDVIQGSLPAIKRHWSEIFQEATLKPKAVPIPAPVTAAQLDAINEVSNAAAAVCIERLKEERCKALVLLMNAELTLAYYRRHGVPPGAQI